MQLYQDFTRAIIDLFRPISDFFLPLGIPFGPEAWFFIITVSPLVLIILALVLRGRRGARTTGVDEGIKKIIASTGDVSSGIAGVKKLKFLKTPSQALIFLKVEENAIQQALVAVDYYAQQGDLDESLKAKVAQVYEDRLSAVQQAIAKDEELKAIVDTSSAVDRARSDYLQKLAAMSGTTVETDELGEAGPSSVGVPGAVSTGIPSGGPPGGAPPSGGPPAGGPPRGGPPSGGPPAGVAPSGGPPGGAPPSGGPPGGAPPSGGPPGGIAPSGAPPGGAPPGGAILVEPAPKSTDGKSSLQSEMLQEMERLKALMGGD
ncbi:MAG: hypothetical protein OEV85_13275 [Candidatus Thorarchaeota archaeon]|nr:hypothetical protein [Candidatus Thorarchaeota archaeon]